MVDKKYNHKDIEKKIQSKWKEAEIFKTDFENQDKEKFYLLDMFSYPSGSGLHMGHTEQTTIMDTYYRYKKMKGINVLHPQGFDGFGLPAENYAIKTGVHPEETTFKAIENFKRQMESLGLLYDFMNDGVVTCKPEYYKWTQWIFGKFFENGLVYKKTTKANWCPSCQTVIANEQVENGKCERCKTEIEQKDVPSWMFRITDFADDLIWKMDEIDFSVNVVRKDLVFKGEEIKNAYFVNTEGKDLKTDFKEDAETFERVVPFAIVKNKKTNQILCLDWKKTGWKALPAGGVEEGEDVLESIKREILEETGYKNIKFIKKIGEPFYQRFFRPHKGSNVFSKHEIFYFELLNDDRDDIDKEELEKHEAVWIDENKVKCYLTTSGPQVVWDFYLKEQEPDWPEHTKKNQNAWIGKSEGAKIKFNVSFPKKEEYTRVGVYALLKKDNKYLTYFSEKNNEYWLPGGKVESGEDFTEALKREIIEETGYTDFKINEKISETIYDVENSDEIIKMIFFEVDLLSEKSQEKQLSENEKKGGFDNWKIEWVDSKEFAERMKKIKTPRSLALSVPFLALDNEKKSDEIEVFTTRPDTLFGATYMVLAPEHELVKKWKDKIENWDEVEKYLDEVKKKTELERLEAKEKTGVELKGIKAINPANKEEIPIFISDYVLSGYGTGAIMAVPAHDERDFEFAKKFGIKIRQVVAPYFEGEDQNKPRKDVEILKRKVIDVIIESPDGKILLQKDSDWHFVGGGVENGENLIEAVKREVREETGFVNFEEPKEFFDNMLAFGYRVTKEKNQDTNSTWFHLKLKDLTQEKSEIEDGKHIVEWVEKEEVAEKIDWKWHLLAWKIFNGEIFSGRGVLVNSGEFDGMDSEEAKKKITEFVGGEITSTYRLRDWSISRQRYWGTPIPIVYDPEGKAHYVGDENLPWTLPTDVDFVPTGEAPLAKSKELKERVERIFGEGWTPEVDTMDTFVDSSWYFLRYPDPNNDQEFASEERLKKWMPVDLYVGGAEHTYMHLLFARFFTHAMHKIGLIDFKEPFLKLRHQGMILDKEGKKMSKSKGNVVNPDEMVERFGADATRAYMLFAGPIEEDKMWNEDNIVGIYRWIEKIWRQQEKLTENENLEFKKQLHKTIKKVSDDIENLRFNVAIAEMMKLMNFADKEKEINKGDYFEFIKLASPIIPHVADEILGEFNIQKDWPSFDEELAKDDLITLAVQVNGKKRGEIKVSPEAEENEVIEKSKENEEIAKWLEGEIVKVIYVKGRILNFVVK